MKFGIAIRFAAVLILCGAVGAAYSALPVTQNLILHLDGDHASVSGGYVTQLIDQSGKGNHAISELQSPVLASGAANGHNAVDFAGGALLSVPASEDFEFDQCTIFMICKYPDNPDLRYSNYLLTFCYDLPNTEGQSFQNVYNNHGISVIERTLSLWSSENTLRATAYNKNAVSYTEGAMPYYGFKGWTLIVMTLDTRQSGAATLEGNTDLFINPFTAAFPTLSANKKIRRWQAADSSQGHYTFENHILCTLGGRVDFEGSAGDPYPGTYSLAASEAFEGMVAEVAVYSKALSTTEIQSVATYLNQKYNCGSAGWLMDVPTFYDCRYYQDTGRIHSTDFNADCRVDFADFVLFAEKWLDSY